MFRRLAFVVLNYLTRPMVWAVGGTYLVVLGFVLAAALQESTLRRPVTLQAAFPEFTSWGQPVDLNSVRPLPDDDVQRMRDAVGVLHQVTAWQSSPAGASVDANQPSITEFSAAHLRRLRDSPRLRSLALQSSQMLTDEEMQAVGDLHQIESLSLTRCSIGPRLWRELARLPKLRYLDLSGCSFWGDYPDLDSLAHLDTLILGTPKDGGFIENETSLFPNLHRLPKLRTLVVSDYTPVSTVQISNNRMAERQQTPLAAKVNPLLSNVDDLKTIQTLRRLFIYEQTGNFPGFDHAQRELPTVKVRPAFVDANRQQAFLILIFLNSILLFLLALQVQSQFSHSGARLIPNYAVPHFVPAIGIWMIGIIAHTVPLITRDVPFWAALGANLSCWTILCSASVLGSLTNIDPRRLRWVMLPLVVVAASWFPLTIILMQFNRSSIDWYLRGKEPLWTAFFIASGVTVSATALLKSLRLHSIYLERGIGSPPLGMDPVAMAEWQQQVYWRNSRQAGAQGNRRLTRIISRARQPGWRQRCNLWIAGNSNNGKLALLFMFGVVFMGLFGSQVDGRSLDDFPAFRHPLLLVMSVFFPDLPVIALASLWRNRRRMFPVESLRAMSRADFSRQVAGAIAWDLAPLGAVYLAVLCWYVAVADPLRWSWGWTMAVLLVFVARWIAVFALLLWVIIIRNDWVLVLVSAGTGYTLLFVNLGFAFLQGPVLGVGHLPPDLPHLGVLPLGGIALIFVLITSSMAALAYRRWHRIELL